MTRSTDLILKLSQSLISGLNVFNTKQLGGDVGRKLCSGDLRLSNFYPGKLMFAAVGDDWSCNCCYQCGDWLGEGANSPISSSSDIKLVSEPERHQTGEEQQHNNMKVSSAQ